MTFDKEEYWKNRRNGAATVGHGDMKSTFEVGGKRGQGPDPTINENPKIATSKKGVKLEAGHQMRMTKNGIVPYPRRDQRRRIVDRHFTKSGYRSVKVNGTTVGAVAIGGWEDLLFFDLEAKAPPAEIEHKHPKFNPQLSNNERMKLREDVRRANREAAGLKLPKVA